MTKATDSPQPREALARWYTRYASPVGTLYIAARADAVVGIWYEDQAHFPLPHELGGLIENPDAYLRDRSATEGEEPAGEYAAAQLLSRAAAELSEYFERKRTSFTLPLDPEGTDFQLIVWEHLKTVPAGYTTTYGEISRPCHRVIGADGSLTGYAGGVERKQFLLDLEEPEEVREARLF